MMFEKENLSLSLNFYLLSGIKSIFEMQRLIVIDLEIRKIECLIIGLSTDRYEFCNVQATG